MDEREEDKEAGGRGEASLENWKDEIDAKMGKKIF